MICIMNDIDSSKYSWFGMQSNGDIAQQTLSEQKGFYHLNLNKLAWHAMTSPNKSPAA